MRKDGKPRKTRRILTCQRCGDEFVSSRRDAKTCSTACRKALNRDISVTPNPGLEINRDISVTDQGLVVGTWDRGRDPFDEDDPQWIPIR